MNFSELPYEVQFRYLLGLSGRDVLNYCQTSQRAREICASQDFWKQKSLLDYGLPSENAVQYDNLALMYQNQPQALIGIYMDSQDIPRLKDVVSRTNSRYRVLLERYFLQSPDVETAQIFHNKFSQESCRPRSVYRELYQNSEGDLKDLAYWWYHDVMWNEFSNQYARGNLRNVMELLPEMERVIEREDILLNALIGGPPNSRAFLIDRYRNLLRNPETVNRLFRSLIDVTLESGGDPTNLIGFLQLVRGTLSPEVVRMTLAEGAVQNYPEVRRVLESYLQ